MSPDENDRPLDPFETQLAALRPAASGVDRARIAYEVGRIEGIRVATQAQRQSRRSAWFWPLATALSLAVAVAFAVLWQRETGRPVLVQTPLPAARDEGTTASPEIIDAASPTMYASNSYLQLRQVALHEGIDALPERVPTGDAAEPPTVRWLTPLGDI